MIEICKYCENVIQLIGENIGNQIGYYGTCSKCNASYSKDVDARDSSRVIRERYYIKETPKPDETPQSEDNPKTDL